MSHSHPSRMMRGQKLAQRTGGEHDRHVRTEQSPEPDRAQDGERKLSQTVFGRFDPIAAHCEPYSRSCSTTNRTARSRTSREYLVDLFIAPSSQRLEPPGKPGRFTS